MAFNQTVESPDFDRIERGNDRATASAIRLLWQVANDESKSRRTGVTEAIERWEKKTIAFTQTGDYVALDSEHSAILRFSGTTSVGLHGIRARVEGTVLLLMVLGTGTVSLVHESGPAEARNRILTYTTTNLAVTTNKAAMLVYLNTRWREVKWA